MAVNINIPSQVKTYANLAAFPASGSLKTIYIAEDTNKTYRWTGSIYVEISASAAMTWGQIGGTLSNQTDLQNALDAKVPTARTLTINGTTQDLSANRTFTIPTDLTVGTTPISSGTIGRVLFQGTGNVLQQSSSLAYDDTTKVFTLSGNQNAITSLTVQNNTVGTAAQANITVTANSNSAQFTKLSTGLTPYKTLAAGDLGIYNTTSDISLLTEGSGKIKFAAGGVSTAQMTLFATGNLGINTTTDAGFRLDVNGTARVQGQLTVTNGGAASIQLNAASARITIGSAGNYFNRLETYSAGVFGFVNDNTGTEVFRISNKTIWTSGVSTGFNLLDTLTLTGQLFGINTATPAIQMNVFTNTGSGTTVKRVQLFNGDTGKIVLNETGGNVLIGTTTDAGFKLDVNGTARVVGRITAGDASTAGDIRSNPSVAMNFGGGQTTNTFTFRQINSGAFPPSGLDQSLINLAINQAESTNNPNRGSIIAMGGTINNTGSNAYVYRGIYYNPTIVSLTNTQHYAWHSTSGRIRFENLPTSSAGLSAGDLWNDGGTLKIV